MTKTQREKIELISRYSIIGLFTISVIIGFFLGLISAELFLPLASSVITYLVMDRKNKIEIENLKASNAEIVDLDEKEQI